MDSQNAGLCSIMLRRGVPSVLRLGALFMIGDNNYIRVSKLSSTRITLNVVSDSKGVVNATKEFTRDRDIIIGSAYSSQPKEIMFDDSSVSRLHAKVYFADEHWKLEDCSSNGTWMNLMNYESSSMSKPSEPKKLEDGDIIGAQYYRFEVSLSR